MLQINIAGTGLTNLEVTTQSGITIKTTNVPENAGYLNTQTVTDAGSITNDFFVKSVEMSQDYRFRGGIDTLMDFENFNYSNQNVNKHFYRNNTLTIGLTSSGLTTNNGGTTTQNCGSAFNTHRYFPIYTASSTFVEFNASINVSTIPTNTIINFGLFQPGAANLYLPVDGCGFRYTNYSGLTVFQNINTTEYSIALNFIPITGKNYHYVLAIDKDIIECYINDILYGKLQRMIVSPTVESSMLAGAQPMCISHYVTNDGIAGGICKMSFTSYGVSLGDWHTSKPWHYQLAGMGMSGNLLQDGYASGSFQTPIYPAYNDVIATTTPLSGGTASAIGLGGRTQWTLVDSENSLERILFYYQIPVASSTVTGRNLYITGVRISTTVPSATVNPPTAGVNCIQYDLGYGSTTLALNASETATFSGPTTKAYRKLPLGCQNIGTNVAASGGTVANIINVELSVPVVAHPGEYVSIIIRELNTKAGGVLSTGIEFDSYWE